MLAGLGGIVVLGKLLSKYKNRRVSAAADKNSQAPPPVKKSVKRRARKDSSSSVLTFFRVLCFIVMGLLLNTIGVSAHESVPGQPKSEMTKNEFDQLKDRRDALRKQKQYTAIREM